MRKLFALLLSGVLLAASVPVYGNAEQVTAAEPAIAKGEPVPGSQTEPTTKGLESVILAVKEKITIPEEYSDFNYYFSDASSYSDAFWNLTWSNPKTNASIQVNCDGDYHITYYYQYDYKNKTSSVAKYLKTELQSTAYEFIAKIAPETKGHLEYLSADYESVYSGVYAYHFQRRNNGVAFPDNTVTVWVNSVTGEVTGASVNWLYDVTVPSAKVKITKAEAIQLLKDNMKMKLVYHTNYYYGIYDKTGASSSKKAFLVYEPSLGYISVDAKSKEIYLTRNQWIDTAYTSGSAKMESAMDTAVTASGAQSLTEEEAAKVEELKKLISKSEAIKTITGNSALYLEKTLKSYTASLSKFNDISGKTTYVWNISLTDPTQINYEKESDYYRAYAYATVDAVTGKILSFYSSVKSNYDTKSGTWSKVDIKYDKEKCKSIFESFLKKQTKEHFDQSVLATENNDYIAFYKNKETPVYGGYSYQYNRVNEGVEFADNYLSGSVDGVSGKIYSYNTNWDDSIVFESAKGAMTADQAMDYYLGNEGFALKYEINVINKFNSNYSLTDSLYENSSAYSTDYKIRLVYRPDVTPSYISPFTGKQLSYDGTEYTETKPYTYQDIPLSEKYRNILLLADMNLGFEGSNFYPEQAITVGEIKTLLQSIGYGYDYSSDKDPYANNLLTKETLADIFITKLGLEKVSKLSIYTTGFSDENNIGDDYLGDVALAKGLGLITADDDNKFYPKSNITRADAVNYIFNFIDSSQKGVLY